MFFSNSGLRIFAVATILGLAFSLGWQTRAQAFFFGGVSIRDEKEMGKKFDTLVRSHMPVIEDPEIRQYADDVLKKLLKGVPRQPYNFKTSVILNNSHNAFAIPGGYTYIFTGLLMNLDSEEELAGIMAHELAHVTQRHVAARMDRAQFFTLGSLLVAIAGIALAGPGGAAAAVTAAGAGQSAMLNYSRIDESDADTLGLQYLTAAGYPPQGMIGGFKALRQKNWMSGVNIPTYLSTHPAIGDRINNISARVAAMPDAKKNAKTDNSRFNRVKTLLWARYGDERAALRKFSGGDGLSLMGKGVVLSRMNKTKEATAAFDSALKRSPRDPLILREAGIFHFRKGDMSRAERLLGQAMSADPRDYMASFFYGRVLDETGGEKRAPQYYRDVLRRVPEEAEVHRAFARSLGKAGDESQAYIHLAYAEIYDNNKKMAEKYFKRAEALAGKTADKKPFDKLKAVYEERKKMWDGAK
ncbi:MAG: M48 family metalloprotease [Desulfovibrio sp.]|nr:M48 family metalloprotease [Desulfovibrio sp.]